MHFGCFGFVEQIDAVAKAGFSEIELDLGQIANMNGEEFRQLQIKAVASGLGFSVFSGLLPLSVRIHDQSFDESYWLDRIEIESHKAQMLGAKLIPFGAGKCRSIPDDCHDITAAKQKVAGFIDKICSIFGRYGITMVIEPLGPANSNFLNTIPETVWFIRGLSAKNCYTMCDLRHMHKMSEGYEDIIKYKDMIKHAHIDYPRGIKRYFPKADDGFDYSGYFKALSQAGYQGILTIEATEYNDFLSEAAAGRQVLLDQAAAIMH